MKNVKILGSGCKRCMDTAEMARSTAERLGITITLEKVTDYAQIASFGIAATPGVVVDGKVVHAGGLPRVEDMEKWLVDA